MEFGQNSWPSRRGPWFQDDKGLGAGLSLGGELSKLSFDHHYAGQV
jgi:hypothetical protein